MIYRLCLSVQPGLLQLENPQKWEGGQVYYQFPKTSGSVGIEIADVMFRVMLGNNAPNVSVVSAPLTGSVGKDGSPTGCYGSLHRNESDITFMPIEYPILDYDKVDPVQTVDEGRLSIISTYRNETSMSIEYQDLLFCSLKSFDINVWTVVVLSCFMFAGLLILRKFLDPKYGSSPLFETFSHFIGQDLTNFEDRPGRLISFTMAARFFLIIVFFILV